MNGECSNLKVYEYCYVESDKLQVRIELMQLFKQLYFEFMDQKNFWPM